MNIRTAALLVLALTLGSIESASAEEYRRCAPLDFRSSEFRNITQPGDVHILPTDKFVLINKRKPEATRVIFGRATDAHSPVVVVKDCSGTAREFPVTISGEIDAGSMTLNGNFGTQALRHIGGRWMIQ